MGFASVFFNKERGWISAYTGLTRAEQFSEGIAHPFHMLKTACALGRFKAGSHQ